MRNLSFVRGCVLDLDGTVYRGMTPIRGAIEAVRRLQQASVPVAYLSNNASVSRAGVAAKLTGLGLEAHPKEVITGTSLAANYVRHHYPGKKALLIGEPGLLDELRLAGVKCCEAGDSCFRAEEYGVVVVGCDRHFNYRKLNQALQVTLTGGALVATDGDATYPTENGLMPGTGAVLAGIERAAGFRAIVAGKPSEYSASQASAMLGLPARACLVIGDRLDSDIAVGRHLGGSAHVFTGVTTEEELRKATGDQKPDFVFPDLPAVVEAVLGAQSKARGRHPSQEVCSDRSVAGGRG